MKYKELIEYFQQRFKEKVLDVVKLPVKIQNEDNWYDVYVEKTGKSNCYYKWVTCKMNVDDYKIFIRNKKIEELI
jgi:hypothetical protein